MSPADQVLFDQWITRRDASAFTRLAEKYAAMVYAVGKRITGNAHDAEDVAQAAFETLASQRRVPKVHLGAWLHRVATYRALNHLKAENRRAEREARYDRERPKHTEIGWDDIYELVDEAIAALPDKQRDVVVAHYLEGKTHDAIARELGVSRPAVTQRVQAGVAGIRAALGKRGVAVPLVALGAMLANGAEAAVPIALAAQLGKIALSGYVGKTGASIGLWQALIEGLGTAKGLVGIALVCGTICVSVMLLVQPASEDDSNSRLENQQLDVEPNGHAVKSAPISSSNAFDESRATIKIASSVQAKSRGLSGTITGLVVDDSGNPMPEAKVYISYLKSDGRVQTHGTSCDDQGVFLSSDSKERPIFLHATPPLFTLSSDSVEPNSALYTISEGEHPESVKLVINQGDYLSIQGTVRDSAGRPLAGALIYATSHPRAFLPDHRYIDSVGSSGPTDGSGRFVLPYVRTGNTYRVRASVRHYSPASIIGVEPGHRDLDVTLTRRGALEGRVLNALTGRPVPQFTCSSSAGLMTSGPEKFTQNEIPISHPDGRFRFEEASGGDVQLSVSATGYVTEDIQLPEDSAEVSPYYLEVALQPLRKVSGWVRDSQGQPIEGVIVLSMRGAESQFPMTSGGRGTDADGSFELDVPEISDTVAAGHPEYIVARKRIDWPNLQPMEIVLARGGAVEGQVTLDGAPVAGAEVWSRDVVGVDSRLAQTDNLGHYRIAGLAPGEVHLGYRHVIPGTGELIRGAAEATVQESASTKADYAFAPPSVFSSLEGVVSSGGTGLPFARLGLTYGGSREYPDYGTRTDASGHFRFAKIRVGRADLSVYVEEHCVKRMFLDVPEGASLTQDVVLESGTTLICAFENLPPDFANIVVALFADEDDFQITANPSDLGGALRAESFEGHPVALGGILPGAYTIEAFVVPATGDTGDPENPLNSRQPDWPEVRVPVVVGDEAELEVRLHF